MWPVCLLELRQRLSGLRTVLNHELLRRPTVGNRCVLIYHRHLIEIIVWVQDQIGENIEACPILFSILRVVQVFVASDREIERRLLNMVLRHSIVSILRLFLPLNTLLAAEDDLYFWFDIEAIPLNILHYDVVEVAIIEEGWHVDDSVFAVRLFPDGDGLAVALTRVMTQLLILMMYDVLVNYFASLLNVSNEYRLPQRPLRILCLRRRESHWFTRVPLPQLGQVARQMKVLPHRRMRLVDLKAHKHWKGQKI